MDANASVHFRSWVTLKGICNTRSYYSYELKRLLNPAEHLQLLGYDLETFSLKTLQRSDARDLAGNAQHLLQVALILYPLLLVVPFSAPLWERGPYHEL